MNKSTIVLDYDNKILHVDEYDVKWGWGSVYNSCGFQGGGVSLYLNFVRRGSSRIWIMDRNLNCSPLTLK